VATSSWADNLVAIELPAAALAAVTMVTNLRLDIISDIRYLPDQSPARIRTRLPNDNHAGTNGLSRNLNLFIFRNIPLTAFIIGKYFSLHIPG
jgi:hypothetical protein